MSVNSHIRDHLRTRRCQRAQPWRCWRKQRRAEIAARTCTHRHRHSAFTRVRDRAETGLVMLRGRIGGDGAPFNVGEATVTRAAVQLAIRRDRLRLCARPRPRKGAAGRALRRAAGSTTPSRSRVEDARPRAACARLQQRAPALTARADRRRPGSTSSRWCAGRTIDDIAARDFANPAFASQAAFRARHGRHGAARRDPRHSRPRCAAAPLAPATAALALTLCRPRDAGLARYRRSARRPAVPTGCASTPARRSSTDPRDAAFALIADAGGTAGLRRTSRSGTEDYPDRSTTLIVQVATLSTGDAADAARPRHQRTAAPSRRRRCRDDFAERLRANRDTVPARRRPVCWWRTTRSRRCRARCACDRGGLSMYVAVKGGERAIDNAHALLADERRGDPRRAGTVARPDRRAARRSRSTA